MRRALVVAAFVLFALPASAHAVTYTVNTTGDAGDLTCDASCTLRDAIDDANASTTVDDEIMFTVTPIVPTSALPSITDKVTINGTDALDCAGNGFVGLDGNDPGFDGLHFAAGSETSRLCRVNVRDFSDGIQIDANGVTIEECRIGTNPDGTTAQSNNRGIFVDGASNTTVRDCQISGNSTGGIILHEPPAGASTGNVIADNIIGLDAGADAALANFVGVQVNDDVGVTIGGTNDGDANYIGGNTQHGVTAANDTVVVGNHIGTNDNGDVAVPNGSAGVAVVGSGLGAGTTGAVIGDPGPFGKNVISGNDDVGVSVDADGALVRNNWIGPAEDQDAPGPPYTALAGQGDAVIVHGGADTVVEDNVIAGHTHYGVWSDSLVDDLIVRDNLIGLLPDGVTPVSSDEGVDLDYDTTDAIVEDNTIAGQSGAGIEVAGTGTDIVGNTFGRDAAGAATDDTDNDEAIDVIAPADDTLIVGNRVSNSNDQGGVQIWSGLTTLEGNVIDANHQSGVAVRDTATVRIGGSSEASSNEISDNAEDGIDVSDTAALVEVGRSSIHDNGTTADHLGIDLGADGVTGEDTTDGIQDFPAFTSAATRSSDTDVTGLVLAIAGHDVRLDVYSSPACDASGNGEGATWLGSLEFTSSGFSSFEGTVDGGSTPGQQITATSTDLDTGTTSEFSECFTATQKPEDPAPPDPDPDPGTTPPPSGDGATPPPPGPIVPLPIVVPPAPKFPAKLAVLRNGVDDGVLDMLIQVTSRSVTPGAVLELDYNSSGKHTRFTVPITSTQIKVRKKLPKSQPKDTGIVEIEYDGNDLVNPDSVRLRAADGKSKLVRSKSSVTNGKLAVEGTIAKAARGVVRIRLEFDRPDGTTGTLFWNVKIAGGKWKLSETLPAEAARGGQLSIQFTGYEKENLRGEQAAKQVLS